MLNSLIGIIASSGGAAAAASSYESIATTTVGSGGAASITFSSIPSTYTHLQIRFIARGADGGAIYTQFNGDTGANYSSHNINGNGSTVIAQAQTSTANPLIIRNGGISTTANIFSAGIVDILDYANTSKNKTLRSLAGQDLNGSGLIEFASNARYNTAAITSITLTHNGSGFTQYSSFALYGIKGA
jgi:hypothetical protein